MNRKKYAYSGNTERWGQDVDKSVAYEFEFKSQLIKPGMQLRFKNDHSIYTFKCLVTQVSTGNTWLELTSTTGFHSKRIEQISRVVGIKRSYKKKVAV